jgi:hypothetical protein
VKHSASSNDDGLHHHANFESAGDIKVEQGSPEKYSKEEEEHSMHGSDENEHGRNQEVSWQSQENYISADNFEVHSNECSKK